MSHDPGGFLLSLARAITESRGPASVALLLLLLAAHSALAFRAMAEAGRGWIGHLPVTGRERLVAVSIAGALATFPVVIVWVALLLGGVIVGLDLYPPRIAALPLTLGAAIALTVPVKRRFVTRGLGVLAAVAAIDESVWGSALACLCLGFAAFSSGGLEGRSAATSPPEARVRSVRFFSWRIAIRALGATSRSGYVSAYLSGLLPLAIAFLFLKNNELLPHLERMGVRVGSGLAAVLFVLVLTEQLGRRRPAWAFARSLPWTAVDRTRYDVELIAFGLLPIFALGLWMSPRAALPSLAVAVFATLRALASIRPSRDDSERSALAVAAECVIAALLVGVHPAWALLLIPGTLWAGRALVRAERRQRVGAWRELEYAVEGDPSR